jgi:coenzyme F420-0:L-glutamate ligase/coenzyme F420-1:gamma-L-glutamate ligase
MSGIEAIPVTGLGEIEEGASLGTLIAGAAAGAGLELSAGDIVVVSHKVVSKSEGRRRRLAGVEPGERAVRLAAELDRDPRLVQVVLDESRSVLRAQHGVLITETRSGWICANSGVDASNVPGDDTVVLLPVDGDASARRIRAEVAAFAGVAPGVVVADSFGRAWRMGQADVAIGCAGIVPLDDWRGRPDSHGRELSATVVAVADEVAGAADLARDKDSGTPAAVVRGLERHVVAGDGPGAAPLRRAEADDLFR